MFNNSYGYGVYKRSQVNIGNPYQIKQPATRAIEEDFDDFRETSNTLDEDLLISQDIIHKAKEEAVLIIREAELEAERILSEAKQTAEQMALEAEKQARDEGFKEGEALAQEQFNDLLAEAQEFKERSKVEYEETMASLEQDVLELVLNIAEKVVSDEVRNNREAILGIVRQTLRACSNREHVVLKVSAEDYETVVENQEKLRSMVRDLNELEIRKDGTLKKGSCIVDNGFGSVDGSADLLLENIKDAFYSILNGNGGTTGD